MHISLRICFLTVKTNSFEARIPQNSAQPDISAAGVAAFVAHLAEGGFAVILEGAYRSAYFLGAWRILHYVAGTFSPRISLELFVAASGLSHE